MSVIATPPEERHPVLTLVGPYDKGQVRAAIRRELAREGQVFFVHNRVDSIDKVATELREPGAGAPGRHRPTGRMGEVEAGAGHARTSGSGGPTCWCAPPSSRRA